MEEALLVAQASGIALDRNAVLARAIEVCRAAHAATSSTQQDIARGRPTEIDSLNGFFATRVEECGLKAPVNGTLAALVKLKERVPRGA